ncbi:MAG: hypothetical protein Q7U86_09380 [Draconibacterium sp.]|nr:hypothetical protein [Draconibacterium sp.]
MNNKILEEKVKHLVHSIVYEKGFVCSVDILLRLGYLSQTDYESWRFGKIAYLEKACIVNLSKLSTINKVLRKTAFELKLNPSITDYRKHGKGVKIKLQFSKSGDKKIEEFYATHFIDKKRIGELKLIKNNLRQQPPETTEFIASV